MARYVTLLALLSILLLAACGGDGPQQTNQPESRPTVRITQGDDARLEPFLQDLSAGLTAPQAGIAAAIIQDGEVTIGYTGNPDFDADTLFEFGSITKVFTAILLAQLANEGLVALDDPVNDHLPSVLQDAKWEPVTLRDLATHTAGLPRLPDNMNPFVMLLTGQMDDPYARFDQERLEEALRQAEVDPNVAISDYSNFGYALLGDIVGRAGGSDYTTMAQQRLFEPLGMSTTRIDEWATANQAPPLNGGGEPTSDWTLNAFRGAGAARGSLNDAIAFAQASLAACRQTDALSEANCLAQQSTGVGIPGGSVMGLGWTRTTENGQTAIWHNGGTGGYRTFLGINPETGTGIVLLSNLGDFGGLDAPALALLTEIE